MRHSSSSINFIRQNPKLRVAYKFKFASSIYAHDDEKNRKKKMYRKFSFQFIYIHDQT